MGRVTPGRAAGTGARRDSSRTTAPTTSAPPRSCFARAAGRRPESGRARSPPSMTSVGYMKRRRSTTPTSSRARTACRARVRRVADPECQARQDLARPGAPDRAPGQTESQANAGAARVRTRDLTNRWRRTATVRAVWATTSWPCPARALAARAGHGPLTTDQARDEATGLPCDVAR